jgi:Trk-type K+ transport system membrane component
MWRNRLFYLIGFWVLVLACLQLVPLFLAVLTDDSRAISGLFTSMMVASFLGGGMVLGFRSTEKVRVPRLTVFLPLSGFTVLAILAGLPFFFLFPERGFLTAFYDGMSQITTNGSTAYEGAIEGMPSLILWRALTGWVGGLLAIAFALSMLMALNSGGMQLHRSPLHYGESEAGYPRLRATAQTIAPLYGGVTALCFLLLSITGAKPFDAVILSLSLVSTSGGVPESMVQSQQSLQQIIMAIFLIIGLSNWDFHYLRMKNRTTGFNKDRELRITLFVLICGTVALFLLPLFGFRDIISLFFASASALSTFGVMPANVVAAEDIAVPIGMTLMLLAAIGGGVASTTGGLKQMRVITIIKLGRAEVDRLAHPHGVSLVKYGSTIAEKHDIGAIWLLLGSFVLIITAGAIALAVLGVQFEDAVALAFTAMTLSGPLIIGSDPTFAGFDTLNQSDYLILSILMLIGRVEASLFMAVFAKALWRG